MSNLTETLFGVTVPTQPKHTPGPWKMIEEATCFTIYDPSGDEMATVYKTTRASEEENKATAHLIAESPNLADVLEAAHDCFNGQQNLLSTATDDERKVVVENFLNWWNSKALPLLERIEESD